MCLQTRASLLAGNPSPALLLPLPSANSSPPKTLSLTSRESLAEERSRARVADRGPNPSPVAATTYVLVIHDTRPSSSTLRFQLPPATYTLPLFPRAPAASSRRIIKVSSTLYVWMAPVSRPLTLPPVPVPDSYSKSQLRPALPPARPRGSTYCTGVGSRLSPALASERWAGPI